MEFFDSLKRFIRGGTGVNNAHDLEARLRAIMESWALPIASDCRQLLADAIHHASIRAEAEDVDPWPDRVALAESSLRKLLTEMTWQAGVMGLNELHEPTLHAAFQRLCPLWPFC